MVACVWLWLGFGVWVCEMWDDLGFFVGRVCCDVSLSMCVYVLVVGYVIGPVLMTIHAHVQWHKCFSGQCQLHPCTCHLVQMVANAMSMPCCPMSTKQRFAIACEGGTAMAKGKVAKGKVAKGKVTKGQVAKGMVAKGKVANGKVAKGKVAKGMVAKGKVAKLAKDSEPMVQKCKAKVHAMKLMKKPVVMKVPQKEEEEEEKAMFIEEGEEEEPKEQDKDEEDEDDVDKPNAKDYYHFNAKLATAPRAVQEAVSKIKALPFRGGKRAKMQELATAFAKSGWNHKLFKSIEQLEISRAQKKEAKAYPRQVMVTKCGGEEGFDKASM